MAVAEVSNPVDYAKVQRNVKRIIDGGGKRDKVLAYLRHEGVNPEDLRAYGRRARTYDSGSLAASKFTMGLSDKASGVASAIAGEVKELFGKAGPATFGERYSRGVEVEKAARDAYRKDHPVTDAVTAPLSILGGGSVGSAAATTGLTRLQAAKLAGRQGAVGGGVSGGLSAFGDAEGSAGEQVGQTLTGAALGAGIGYGIGRYVPGAIETLASAARPRIRRLGEMLKPRREAVQTGAEEALDDAVDGRQVYEAAKRLGVEVLPADVGGPITRRISAAAVQTPLGAGPIVNAAQRSVAGAQTARDRIAASAGEVSDVQGAGEAIQRGAREYISTSGARGNRLYRRAERLAGDVRVRPATAVSALDQHIAELAETPETNAAALSVLQSIRNDLSAADLSIGAVRRLRTNVRQRLMKEGLRGGDLERRVSEVMDAATADIVASLANSGRGEAARAYRAADRFWRERVDEIDRTLAPIIGKDGAKSAEQAFQAVERMTRTQGGNAQRLSRLMSSLPDDEAAMVRATIIGKLGNARSGAQNAAGDAFSPQTFLSNWNDMSPRAKAVLFKDPELRGALNDLAKVTGGMREASRFANSSNTGGVVGTLATGGAVTGLYFEPIMSSLALAGQFGAGRLMASPAFARWLVRTPRGRGTGVAQAMKRHVGQLSGLAAKEPAIRNEVLAMQQRLQEAFSRPIGSGQLAAASQGDGEDEPKDRYAAPYR